MIKPVQTNLNANSVGILNAIRDNASLEYYQAVPRVEQTTESIQNAGAAICAFQPRMNEFISSLINRIAKVIVTSKMYSNPWAFAKKGTLEFGETVEEIFVNIANAVPFQPENAYAENFKRNIPDVRSAFHAMDLQTYYPVTISEQQLRQAFVSMDGVTDLIARIVNSLYSAMNYDEFIMMKYTIAVLAYGGSIATVVQNENDTKADVKAIKKVSNAFRFMTTNYNISGVANFSDVTDQYIITTADFDADMDIDVLASAFNLSKAEFMGRRVMVDSFGFNDGEIARLKNLLAKDSTVNLTELPNISTAMTTVKAVIMDRDFFQIYDNLTQFTENYVGSGLYWNEFLHVWRTYSASPFANVAMLIPTAPTITSVNVNGEDAPSAGHMYTYLANVSATPFANKGVTWSVSKGAGAAGTVTIDELGRLHTSKDAAGKWTVTATSVFDSTKSGVKSITFA